LTVVDLSLPSISTTILTDTRVTALKDVIAIEEDLSVKLICFQDLKGLLMGV
jgi:hypothetical protein